MFLRLPYVFCNLSRIEASHNVSRSLIIFVVFKYVSGIEHLHKPTTVSEHI